jgi:hypothetical protein
MYSKRFTRCPSLSTWLCCYRDRYCHLYRTRHFRAISICCDAPRSAFCRKPSTATELTCSFSSHSTTTPPPQTQKTHSQSTNNAYNTLHHRQQQAAVSFLLRLISASLTLYSRANIPRSILEKVEEAIAPKKRSTTKANTSKPRAEKVATGRVEKKTTTAISAPKTKAVKTKKAPLKAVVDKVEGELEKVEGAVEGKPGKKVWSNSSGMLAEFQ